jgi:hypothetical protein
MEQDAVWAGCSIEHEGHFQIGPVTGLVGRGGETPNIGIFDTVLLVFVCEMIEEVILTLDLTTVEGTFGFDGWVGTKISKSSERKN